MSLKVWSEGMCESTGLPRADVEGCDMSELPWTSEASRNKVRLPMIRCWHSRIASSMSSITIYYSCAGASGHVTDTPIAIVM